MAFTYPYLKRFTWLAHFGIGAVYVIIPPAVSIAMSGAMPPSSCCSASRLYSGFPVLDVLYAIADIDFDRARPTSLDTGALRNKEIVGHY